MLDHLCKPPSPRRNAYCRSAHQQQGVPRQVCLLLNMPAFTGHTTGFEARARQAALSLVTIHVTQHAAAGLSVTSDRKSTRLNFSHDQISYAVFCLKKKKKRPSVRHMPNKKKQRRSPHESET